MASSAIAREGKSLTIANLAVAAARAGRRTILVDLDLRQPAQDALFAVAGSRPGVADVLVGRASVDDALFEIPLPDTDPEASPGSLRLLRVGAPPSDPGDLVASAQLELLVHRLRSEADVIYVDTPPTLQAGDAMAISRVADIVVLLSRIGRVKRAQLAELARQTGRLQAPVVGFVATGRRSGASRYKYGSGAKRSGGGGPSGQVARDAEAISSRDGGSAAAGAPTAHRSVSSPGLGAEEAEAVQVQGPPDR
jgi:capsular exopolysaccharide synthesis family protein